MRRCEIDKIGIDLPCMRKAPHFLKIASKHLGDRGKFKIWLCNRHHEILLDQDRLINFLDENDSFKSDPSNKFTATLD